MKSGVSGFMAATWQLHGSFMAAVGTYATAGAIELRLVHRDHLGFPRLLSSTRPFLGDNKERQNMTLTI